MALREVKCVNPECGALNRVPAHSLRRIPQCGKCHARLPEHGATKILRNLDKHPGIVIALPAFAVIGWALWTAPFVKHAVAPACAATAQPRQGIVKWYGRTWGADVANFTITTAEGSNYFVKLEDENGRPVRTFFVNGGSSTSNLVPLGTFKLKYASGLSWCNEQDLFGSDTSTNEADDTFTFDQQPGYTPTQWTVELIRQPGGNLRTHAIPRSQF